MTLTRALLVLVLSTGSVAACAGAVSTGQSRPANQNSLTSAQLAATNSDNLYDAIAKLRPEWLLSRGATSLSDPTPTSVSVFMNGSMLGNADYLKQVNPLDVTEARYWDAASASARFGMGHPRGVIELTRK